MKATVPEKGVVQSESEFTCSVEEYNAMLSDYMSARQSYIERYQDKLETADMMREKIRKMDDELKRLDEEPEIKLAGIPNENEVPDPDEPWDKFMGRIKNTMSMVCDGMKQALRSAEGSVTKLRIMSRRCEEEEKLRDLESNHCITC